MASYYEIMALTKYAAAEGEITFVLVKKKLIEKCGDRMDQKSCSTAASAGPDNILQRQRQPPQKQRPKQPLQDVLKQQQLCLHRQTESDSCNNTD